MATEPHLLAIDQVADAPRVCGHYCTQWIFSWAPFVKIDMPDIPFMARGKIVHV